MAETAEAPVKELTEDEQVAKLIEAKRSGSPLELPKEEEEKSEEKEEKDEKSETETKESEEEKKEKEEEEKSEEEKKEGEPDADLDEQIKGKLGEDYEINSMSELTEILDNVDKVMDENDRLREENETLKKGEKQPEFSSEAQKSAFNFIKNYDPELHRDALNTWATVIGMDVDKVDGKSLLREQFVLSRPEMNRQDAIEKFERDYTRKYIPKKEKFDSDEEYEEAKKDAEIDRKADEAAARKSLKEKQKEFQYKPTEKKEEAKKDEIPDEIRRGIERTAKDLDEYHKGFTEIVFAPSEKKEDNFAWKPKREQIDQIKTVAKSWVSNPAAYDKNGKLVQKLDAEETTMRAAYLLFGDEMLEKIWEHASQVFSIKRAEEIGTTKPDRVAKVTNATTKELSEDEQVRQLIEKRKKG